VLRIEADLGKLAARLTRRALVRQAKLGVSYRVKDPVEQGLTSQSYRVLQ